MEVYYTFKEGGKSYSDESSCLAQRCWKKSESEKLKWTVDSGKLNEEWKPTASGVLQAKIIQTSLFASHQFAETLKLNSESGNEQWTKKN